MNDDWLKPLQKLKSRFAEQRQQLRKYVGAAEREKARVERIISGQKIRRSASRAKADAKRNAEKQKKLREESEHFGATNTSSVVEETSGGGGGRGEVPPAVVSDSD
jgi:hypothetical protein